MKQKISVLVADDKEFMRQSFAKLLCDQDGIQVVGTAVDGEDAVKKAAEIKPQVVLLDIRMPRLNGIQAAHLIRADYPGTGIVIVSAFDDTEYILDLMKNGPEGKAYLLKQSINDVEELCHAIKAVASGGTVLDVSIAKKLAEEYSLADLTEHEQWVLALLAEGYSVFQIMRTVKLMPNILEGTIHSLCRKLHLPMVETNQRNIRAVLALVDPQDRLRKDWVAGYHR